MGSFQDLKVWNESHNLVKKIYIITNSFPQSEKYRLTEQLCKSAASIAANIAEGTGRASKKDFVKFLYIYRGSLEETRNFLILAFDLGYIQKDKYFELYSECVLISKMLNGLIKNLQPKTYNLELTT